MKSSQKDFQRILKILQTKDNEKHTSTVLEPSIPFHTLVKLVDAEDIANDKIRTHDLALEINNITKQLNTQTLDHSSQEQLMYTQPKDPNNKNKPAYKKYCSYCHRTNHSISACFKNNEMIKINEKHMLDQNLHKNHSFSTFVPLQMTKQNTMIIDIEVEVLHGTTPITKNIHKIDTVLHLEIETDFVMIKVLLLHITPDQDMTHINVILDLTVLLTDLLIDLHIDKILVLDTDHALIQEMINLTNTRIHIDHLLDQETLDFPDPDHIPIPEIKSI